MIHNQSKKYEGQNMNSLRLPLSSNYRAQGAEACLLRLLHVEDAHQGREGRGPRPSLHDVCPFQVLYSTEPERTTISSLSLISHPQISHTPQCPQSSFLNLTHLSPRSRLLRVRASRDLFAYQQNQRPVVACFDRLTFRQHS